MKKEVLIELLNQGLSSRSIAKQLDTSQTNVRYWLKKYGLKLRPEHGRLFAKPCCDKCGETDPTLFYGRKTHICARCANQRAIDRGHATKKKARDYLGGRCIACGYSRYDVALDIHHVNRAGKDPAFPSMRGWSWRRLETELQSCVLLCKNCHAAVHAERLSLTAESSTQGASGEDECHASTASDSGPKHEAKLKPVEQRVLLELLAQGLSSQELARELGTSQTNVHYWLNEYGLKSGSRPDPQIRACRCSICGETDPACFYGKKTTICARCGKAYNLKRDRATAKKAREYLGGECLTCGYSQYDVALDIHHVDPTLKDPAFNRIRSWSWKRVERELQECVLLCKNCHAAVHAGRLTLEGLDGPQSAPGTETWLRGDMESAMTMASQQPGTLACT